MIMEKLRNKFYLNKILFKRFVSLTTNNDIQVLKDNVSNYSKRDHKQPKFWTLFHSTPETTNQSFANIFLFPGHGAQFVGMGKNLIELAQVQRLFESASQYLNYNLLKVCLEGPSEKLDKIIHSHPAIYVTSLAALEKIKLEQPQLIENCFATAGYSSGEITSLVFAGALSFEAGLHLIRVRAENMQRACLETKGGLIMVNIDHESHLSKAMLAAKQFCQEKLKIGNPVCEVSSYLSSEVKIIGGHLEALQFIETYAKQFKLKNVERLNAAGAFHTSLMDEAYFPCRNALNKIGAINKPHIITMSNSSGTIHTSTNEIKRLIATQVSRPILWEQILHRLYMRPPSCEHPSTIGIGPRSVSELYLSKVNAVAYKKFIAIDM